MNLKKQLRFYLNKRNMSVSQLSKLAKVPNATLNDWVNGRKPRNLDHVKKVSTALNITIDNLLYGEGEDEDSKFSDISELFDDGWVSGVFEIKIRQYKGKKK